MRLSLADDVPDAKTVWLFRQQLTEAGLVEELFEKFESYLQSQGYQAKGGQMLDATIVPVPKQHLSKEEKEQLDQGEIPQDWQENSHRLSQRDTLCAMDQEKQRKSFWLQRPPQCRCRTWVYTPL